MSEQDRVEHAVLAVDVLMHLKPAQANGMQLAVQRAAPDDLEDRRIEPPETEDQRHRDGMRQAEILGQVLGEHAHWGLCISLISVVRISGARSSV